MSVHRRFSHARPYSGLAALIGIVASCWIEGGPEAEAAGPMPDELAEARQWVAAKFEGIQRVRELESGLLVLANHDPVILNSRDGRPLRIAGKEYARGLYCHAQSEVVVRLPAPGKAFTAVAGLDDNDDTRRGRGSVVFSVTVDGRAAFTSGVLRIDSPAVPVSVDLGGAKEFTLGIDDAGDGISWDQSNWADARVELADGRTVWLGELPFLDASRQAVGPEPFFSFLYGGRPSESFLGAWSLQRETRELDARRIGHTLVYTDPKSGLVVRCDGVEYRDFPTVEWTLHFKNTGGTDSPILSEIQAVDVLLERAADPATEFSLFHQRGSQATRSDYEPFVDALTPGADKRIASSGGRPTNGDLPYFNIQQASDAGAIVAMGWPGQWAARFTRDSGNRLRIRGGQEQTHFALRPGEEVRTPMVALQFWTGGRWHAQNVWRRWMLAHNLPRPGGKLPPVQLAGCSSHLFGEMIGANTSNQIAFIDGHLDLGVPLDYWWMDAGWYPCDGVGWPKTGTWEVDTRRFPKGLREITDHAHARGVKCIVWFEPERVHAETWLAERHPEWILGGAGGGLLNLGNAEARGWLTDHVDGLLVGQGIDLYRQDFNMDPLGHWRGNDAPDRQGITEIRHVEGYLAYWDELRRRHPEMLIDSCASGGRRNDLETLRRAVPLLRSDLIGDPVGNQCHTWGLALWMPYYGTGTAVDEPYAMRSAMCPHLTMGYDMRRTDQKHDEGLRLLGQWRRLAGNYFGDFYPLTPHSLASDVWMAWQFDRPESGEGMVQAFRRAESPYESARFRLLGLDPDATYAVGDVDDAGAAEMTGRELLDAGLLVHVKSRPGAVVVTYKKNP
jgi:alpha-galactosidase